MPCKPEKEGDKITDAVEKMQFRRHPIHQGPLHRHLLVVSENLLLSFLHWPLQFPKSKNELQLYTSFETDPKKRRTATNLDKRTKAVNGTLRNPPRRGWIGLQGWKTSPQAPSKAYKYTRRSAVEDRELATVFIGSLSRSRVALEQNLQYVEEYKHRDQISDSQSTHEFLSLVPKWKHTSCKILMRYMLVV